MGSLLASFSNTANSAALKSNQLFSPYGSARYTSGTLNTARGFTGQYNDTLTGLDYFNARYYDPVVGVFLSADSCGITYQVAKLAERVKRRHESIRTY